MQIGSTASAQATSRLRAAQTAATPPATRAKDEAKAATAGGTALSGGANLLSYMTGQAAAPSTSPGTGPGTALVSSQSLHAWTRELNDNDRALVEGITGCTITKGGSFVGKDGKPATPTPSQAAIVAALSLMRSEQSAAEASQPVTAEQYDALCDRAQVALFQAGSLFDPTVRQAGHDFLNAAPAPTAETAADEEDETLLSVATRHHVEDMVNDPERAMDWVEKYAKQPLAMMVKMPVPENGGEGWVDPAVVQASFDRWKGYYDTVNAVHGRASALFEQGKAAGKSGAEIYADILREQVAQPDEYWQARDPDNLGGVSRERTAAELKALEAAIANTQRR